jgi:hypothetical protein
VTGVIFAEFVDFAETRLGTRVSAPAFSPTQSYDVGELVVLVERVARERGMTVAAVLEAFGVRLFARFAALYPVFFVDARSAVDLLGHINTYVHGEVQKLYPNAEFPRFDVRRPSPQRLELVYHSTRPLADLAEGLIRGCIAHFGDAIDVERHDPSNARGYEARFVLRVRPGAPRGASRAHARR